MGWKEVFINKLKRDFLFLRSSRSSDGLGLKKTSGRDAGVLLPLEQKRRRFSKTES